MKKAPYLLGIFLAISIGGVSALDLQGTYALIPKTAEARSASLQIESALANVALQGYQGDYSLNMEPAYRRTADELFGIGKSDQISLGLSASIPFGVPASAADKLAQAQAQAAYAAAMEEWVATQGRLKAYSLYAAAWIAQENSVFASKERDLTDREYQVAQARFKAGSLGYADFRKAEEAFLTAQEAVRAVDMKRRVSRLELFSWLGISDDGADFKMEKPEAGTLPKAPELASQALSVDPAIRDALVREKLSKEQIELTLGFSLPLTFKLGLSKDDQTGAVSYNTDTKKMSLSYSALLADLSGNPVPKPWTVSASVSIALDSGGADARQAKVLSLAAELEGIKLETALAKLSLDVRTAYQAWVRAAEDREQADRNLAFLTEMLAMVKARAASGGVTETDVARSEMDTEKAAFNTMVKAIDAERSRMNAALIARFPL
jgi:outer membrane protein TolC